MGALGTCARPPRRYTLRLMDPPRPPLVFPQWSFARPARPGGQPATVSEALSELVAFCRLRRRKSLRDAFAEARTIDRLAEELEGLDLPSPASPPEFSLLSLARQQRRK